MCGVRMLVACRSVLGRIEDLLPHAEGVKSYCLRSPSTEE